MATDPYSWAKEFAASQYGRANQADSDRMQMLLNVFTEEAARQRPYVTMPAELQKAEALAAIQRRYQVMRDADKAKAEAATAAGDASTAAHIDASGNEIIMIGGKPYPGRTKEELAAAGD